MGGVDLINGHILLLLLLPAVHLFFNGVMPSDRRDNVGGGGVMMLVWPVPAGEYVYV